MSDNKSACNFNPIMALAAKYVIAEVEEFIENGSIDPEIVKTPGLFINMIVRREDKHENKY